MEALPIPSTAPTRARHRGTRRLHRASVPATAPVVLVETGGPLGLSVDVGATLLTVGRGPGLGLVLDDPAVSEVHCGLALDHGAVVVQDFGSTNGTYVDGRRVAYGAARDGSTLEVGETVLRVFLRTRSRVAFERAHLHLGLWQSGRDPETRLPHGGRLRHDLARACADGGAPVYLALLDVLLVSRRLARRLEAALPAGARLYRHAPRRFAVLSEAPVPVSRLAVAADAVAVGTARAGAVGFDPDRLLLAAAAATRPTRRTTRGRRRCPPA